MSKPIRLRSNSDFEINGNIYFIPDKYTDDKFLPQEYKKLFNAIIALYLDGLLTTNTISSINKITKTHMNEAMKSAEKLTTYVATGKIYISSLNSLEKTIIERIPESLIYNINPNIIEKIEL